jgi:hypothetical protein
MNSETACSKSAQPDSRAAILREALLQRRSELRRSRAYLISAGCLESLGPVAREVEVFLSTQDAASHSPVPANFTWLTCGADFWECLRAIALGRKIECRAEDELPASLSPVELKKLASPDRFKVLCARYRCPWNIGGSSEIEVAEELLRQLMVTERAKLEKRAAVDVDFVLLALNLVGVRALLTHDLRSFDALNYFYELPQRSLVPLRANPRLLAFWLCIYAQLLSRPDWLRCE